MFHYPHSCDENRVNPPPPSPDTDRVDFGLFFCLLHFLILLPPPQTRDQDRAMIEQLHEEMTFLITSKAERHHRRRKKVGPDLSDPSQTKLK